MSHHFKTSTTLSVTLLVGIVTALASACNSESRPVYLGREVDVPGEPGSLLPSDDAGAASDSEAGPAAEVQMCPSDKCVAPLATCSTSKYLCDIDVSTDSLNCGSCGNKCPTDAWRDQNLHAKWICVDGGCQMACANYLWADCNGRIEDGCETQIGTNQDCGACGKACRAGAVCANGACVGCNDGDAYCDDYGGYCADLTSDDYDCGGCDVQCDRQPPGFPAVGRNAYYGCAESTCDNFKCTSPWADCNNNRSDGCEANLTNDAQNCGKCGETCAPGEICAKGACQCNPGPRGCNCLTDFESDLMNCGACGAKCIERPNSTPTCKAGRCGSECKFGYGNCNRDATDGCEINLMKDPQHCGSCGMPCATGQACVDGVCATEPCPPGVVQ